MAKSTMFTGAVSTDWSNPLNWSNGEPAAGDTVSVYLKSVSLTDLDIVSEAVSISGASQDVFAGSSPGAMTKMVIDAGTSFSFYPGRSSGVSLSIIGSVSNAGDLAFYGYTTITIGSDGVTPGQLNNSDTIELDCDDILLNHSLTINTPGSSTFVDDGLVLLTAQSGAVQGDTITLNGITGNGAVSVRGYAYPYLNVINFAAGLQANLALTITDGTMEFGANAAGANSAASLTFANNNGVAIFADVTITPESTPIFGFQRGDAIALGTNAITGLDYDPASRVLHLYNSQQVDLAALTIIPTGQQAYATHDFALAPVTGSVGHPALPGMVLSVDVACYDQGTRILTDRGERPIETLSVGEAVLTAGGATEIIRWIGHRPVDLGRHANRRLVQPICIRAGAMGRGLPGRDLRVSPEHAIFVDGVLIPARCLVGCRGIDVDRRLDHIVYYHIELARHAVILAEGLPSESWLDTGNRAMFANGGLDDPGVRRSDAGKPIRHARPCAKLVTAGPWLAALRLRLGAEPEQIAAIGRSGQHCFVVAPGAGAVNLVSAANTVAGDRRTLGVAIRAMQLDGQAIRLTDRRLGRGFHEPEGEWRWTDGAGSLRLEASDRPRTLVIDVVAMAAGPADLSAY